MYVYLKLVISKLSSGLRLGQLLRDLFSGSLVILFVSLSKPSFPLIPATVLPPILHRLV